MGGEEGVEVNCPGTQQKPTTSLRGTEKRGGGQGRQVGDRADLHSVPLCLFMLVCVLLVKWTSW